MPVIVIGLEELNRSIVRMGPLLSKAARGGLLQGVEGVRQDAGRLSQTEISGMKRAKAKPPPWSIQRKGQTLKSVYVAPTQGRGAMRLRGDDPRKRPNFSPLMMERSYEPALARNENRVQAYVEVWLDKVVDGFNTGGF